MIWLIGAGGMAQDYYKVISHLKLPVTVIGRSESGCESFREKMAVLPVAGGLNSFLSHSPGCADFAIVAVGVSDLFDTCRALLSYGVKRILLEKPGALYIWQLKELDEIACKAGAAVMIAYNRRFYASSQMAKQLIAEDAGVLSFHFEMTEWSHLIGPSPHPAEVKARWLIANTAHLIDLAFYLGGAPTEISCFQGGRLEWHPVGAVFSGAGIAVSGAMFSYTGNWSSAGRWSLELCTAKRKLRLMPLEQLQQQLKGTVDWQPVLLDNSQDHEFKAGLLAQVQAFIAGDNRLFCDLSAQIKRFSVFEQIAGYACSQREDGET
ncbi:Gfo/Idh/MocA family oxidoreductase [Rheinheimera texasensis]|uniref:Gfo/Idh/MocA family oxidoreductase n=1 Tax=Rheinheimera texasensis TaxID=306205 RepID=UPI0004E1D13E|nr:Gfo/Idh/MocA family oxidoreductase [Rheinheimera texasensis]